MYNSKMMDTCFCIYIKATPTKNWLTTSRERDWLRCHDTWVGYVYVPLVLWCAMTFWWAKFNSVQLTLTWLYPFPSFTKQPFPVGTRTWWHRFLYWVSDSQTRPETLQLQPQHFIAQFSQYFSDNKSPSWEESKQKY